MDRFELKWITSMAILTIREYITNWQALTQL